MLKKWTKRKKGSLTKEVRLRPAQLYYRLALENVGYEDRLVDYDAYYKSAVDLLHQRNRLQLLNAASVIAIFLSNHNLLKDFSILYLEVKVEFLRFFLILLFSITSLLLSFIFIRITRYSGLFQAAFDAAKASRKQDLILRYPLIYSPLHFNSWMTQAPNFMMIVKKWPIRVIAILVLSVPAILIYLAFTIWVISYTAADLWASDGGLLGIWSKFIVVTSIAILSTSLIVPSLALLKIRFEHVGMLTLLGRLSRKNPQRYSHFVAAAFDAQTRMGLSEDRAVADSDEASA